MKVDIYRKVTETIINQLEKGVRPWHQPWSAANTQGRIIHPLRANGIPYKGINILILWSEAIEKGFRSPYWMTYKQAADMRAQVRKGEQGTHIVYADHVIRASTDETTGETITSDFSFLKSYCVFNAEQVDGLSDNFYAKPAPLLDPIPRIVRAETFFANLNADIRHGGDNAFYAVEDDYVRMPPFECFENAESYYAALAHECAHWTGHRSRLNRHSSNSFLKRNYAKEELIAELAAAFICADLDLAPQPREEHAAYLEYWVKLLKIDSRVIFKASSNAQRAADYLNNLQSRT